MSGQAVTVNIPEPLYQQIKERAERGNRTVEAEIVARLAAPVGPADELPSDVAEAIAPLSLLSDEELWLAARNRLAEEPARETEQLHHKRHREGLSKDEEETLARLVRQHERVMLVRAEAAALLHKRGHDVSVLLSQA